MSEHDVPQIGDFGCVRQLGQTVEQHDGFEEEKFVARHGQVSKTMNEITVEMGTGGVRRMNG